MVRLDRSQLRIAVIIGVAVVLAVLLALGASNSLRATSSGQLANSGQETGPSAPTVELTPKQLQVVTIAPVGTYLFPVDKQAVGSIDYDENLSVQVFTPYPGKILSTFAEVGDNVKKGQPLYTIDSPDLIAAESNLIGAAASLDLTGKELTRARDLYSHDSGGVSQREYEQAVSDQQTAEGALQAARSAVLVFGKSDADIDRIVRSRQIDPALVVPSPIEGQITARDAQPGLLVQPGNSPAPYSVARITTKWMLANVVESDAPLYHVGQPVQVTVMAFPGRVFKRTIDRIYPSVDTVTHRMTVRSQIADPNGELRDGMLANFVIRVHDPVTAPAVPTTALVHEGDGSMTAWVTKDRLHMTQRVVKIGIQLDGRYQILDGLTPGELVVTQGGVFLSNMLQAPPSD
jgi:cobalt-zinc-cadmium efflux system membrane fusion protein